MCRPTCQQKLLDHKNLDPLHMEMCADLSTIKWGNIVRQYCPWSNLFTSKFDKYICILTCRQRACHNRTCMIQISSPLLYAFIYWPNHGEHTTKCLEGKCESLIPEGFMVQHMGKPSGCYLWWNLLQFAHGHQGMFVMLWGSPLWIYEEIRFESRMFIKDWPLNGNLKAEWCNVYHHFEKHGTKSSAHRTRDWKNHRCMRMCGQRNSKSVGLGCPKVHVVGHSSFITTVKVHPFSNMDDFGTYFP